MLGSDKGNVSALMRIITEEMDGAVRDIGDSRHHDALAKMEYVKSICGNLILLDESVKRSRSELLGTFDAHIAKMRTASEDPVADFFKSFF